MKLIVLLIFIFQVGLTKAVVPPEIVSVLQKEIQNVYLKKLESHLGDCGSSLQSCISKREDYFVANFPKKDICLPFTVCGFYHCMEEKYGCSDVGVNYFTELAYPTCSQYVKNVAKEKFSPKAVEWIYSVMVCLQKGLVDECDIKGNCNQDSAKARCDHITKFTLAFHPGCYINSGVGVCHLPLKDKLAIWKTVSPFMTKSERQMAYKVVFHCLKTP